MITNQLKIGDKVMWRGGFGFDAPKKVTIASIEICKDGEKDGREAEFVSWTKAKKYDVIFTFKENKNWARGTQIDKIK